MNIGEMVKRYEWLASLKVGDEVAIKYGPEYELGTVQSISPKRIRYGVATIANGVVLFGGNGYSVSCSKGLFAHQFLTCVSDPEFLAYRNRTTRVKALKEIFSVIGDKENRTFPNDEELAKIRDDLTAFLEEQEK
jgi:hypothetical protein